MHLFTPFRLGSLQLPNRVIMAPMTRSRGGAGCVPSPLAGTYYAQRASAGFIVTEATHVSAQSATTPGSVGIYSAAQVEGWRGVTAAVHAAGGRIFLQLWHVGRIAHATEALPVAPSAIAARAERRTAGGEMRPLPVPRALAIDEIAGIVAQYGTAAAHARAAGFDGVEIHAANGFLIDQFLRDGSNRRDDRYGGAAANRARFLIEIAAAVAGAIDAERMGVRLSPTSSFNDMQDSDPAATFGTAVTLLNELRPAYLHVVEALPGHAMAPPPGTARVAPELRRLFGGPLVLNGGHDRATAEAAIAAGEADLVSFAVKFLANPDLPERLRRDAPLNPANPATFYGGGAEGYTDYPPLPE
ncbi:alkene reductase [Desertibaculum subflavum]|uniref:alkene reductase n=1 Tax=Desertibaculum subflavum TaxID=2268458 RepID=UPI0034D19D6F